MKRILAVILSMLMIISPLSDVVSVQAADSDYDAVYAYDTVTVGAGETFLYNFLVTSNQKGFDTITVANIYSSFTDKGFTVIDIVQDGLSAGASLFSKGTDNNNILINKSISSTGILFKLKLTAPKVAGKYEFRPSITNNTLGGSYSLYTKKSYGSITVSSEAANNKVNLTYNENGGTGAPDAVQGISKGSSITLSSQTPTRNGYDFIGWSKNASATSADYKAGASITINEDTTLYAVWKQKTYTVSYNANGGTGAPDAQIKTTGVNLTLSSTKPTRSGYYFQGWSTSSTGSVQYNPGDTFTENKNLTLYAVWSTTQYFKVTYNANGGSGAPAQQTKTQNVALTLSSTKPSRTGYTFQGWGTSASATTATYQPGAQYKNDADITLYAVWKANTFTVTFNANGGSGAPANQTKTYGKDLTLSTTKPTRSGYTFQGWGTSSSATTATYQAGGTYSNNSNITLYAIWKINTYTITYNANGGSGAPSAQTKTYGTDLTLSSTQPTRAGYTFKGWGTSASATTATYQPGGRYTSNATTTLYAVWEAIPVHTYTVTYNANGGSGAPAAQTKTENVNLKLSSNLPTRSGYTFQGWGTSASATTATYQAGGTYSNNAAITLYAVWKINTFTVSYNANGGSGAPSAQTKTYGTDLTLSSTQPTRAGYTFKGWGTSASATTATYQPGGRYTSNAAATLYAVWEVIPANTYTVTYNANGGSGAPAAQTKIENVNLALSSTKPTRTGYTFQGWGTSASATTATYQAGGTYSNNAAVTLYAVWKINTFTVSYNANGGSGAPSAQTKTYGTNLTLSSTKPTRTGYTFQGWGTSATATTVSYAAGATYSDNSDVTLYAVWKINTYAVKYNANGGSGAPAAQTKTYGTALSLSTTKPTRTGYTFQGWGTSATATTVAYAAGASYTADKAVTLYAIWKINTYAVKYSANGGSGAPAAQTKTYGTALALSTTKPTRTGYTFQGWGTSATTTTVAYAAGASYTADKAVTLYAIWKINTYQVAFNANGGSGAPAAQTKTYGKNLTLSTTKPTRDGYKFLGWSTSSTATTATYAAGGLYTTEKAVTLYAVWTSAENYTITYSANGGSNPPAVQAKTKGVSVKLSTAVPTRNLYDFLGWATSKTATTATYAPGATYSTDKSITLYAVWKEQLYISKQPTNVSVNIGTDTGFSVTAVGVNLDYQWQYSYDGKNWVNSSIESAKTSNYSFTAKITHRDMYARCVITSAAGQVISDAAKISVSNVPSIKEPLADKTVNVGETASFVVSAVGDGIKYQWQYSNNGSTWNNSSLACAKTNTYSFTSRMSDNMYVRCVVSTSEGQVVSNSVKLTVLDNIAIVSQPKDITADNGSTVAFVVSVTGANIGYQWQFSKDKNTWYDSSLAVAKTNTYKFTAQSADNGMYVRCIISTPVGTKMTDVAKLNVRNIPNITNQPVGKTAYLGETVAFNVGATGNGLKYQWQYSKDEKTWNNSSLACAKTNKYTFTATQYDNMYVRCVVSTSDGEVITNSVRLIVVTNAAITSQPTNKTADNGATVAFTVGTKGTGMSYQWQFSKDGNVWYNSSLASAKTDTYKFTAILSDNNMYVRCIISTSEGSLTTNVAKLSVNNVPYITSQPTSKSVYVGENVSINVGATGNGMSYQWEFSTNNGANWYASSLASAKTSNYTFTANQSHNNMLVRCVVSTSTGKTTSSIAKITVVGNPSISSQPTNKSVNNGEAVAFSVSAVGSNLTYQWQFSKDGSNWYSSSLASAKTNTYQFAAQVSDNNMYVRCIVTSSTGSVTSNVAKLSVNNVPYITSQPSDKNARVGEQVAFSVGATGNGISYQWEFSTNNGANWYPSSLASAVTSSYSFTADKSHNNMLVRCVLSTSSGKVTSTIAKIVVS